MHKILREVCQVFPIEASEPNHFTKNEKLKPYQRQSLAFMQQVEASKDPQLLGTQLEKRYYQGAPQVRGGAAACTRSAGPAAACQARAAGLARQGRAAPAVVLTTRRGSSASSLFNLFRAKSPCLTFFRAVY